MKFAPFSASKLAVFNQCNRKFKYQYVDKIKTPFVVSEALTKGKIIHSLLENHRFTLPEKIAMIKKEKQIIYSEFYTKDLVKECIGIYNAYVESTMGKENFSNKPLATELEIALDKKLKPCEPLAQDVLFRGYIDKISVVLDHQIIEIDNIEDIPEGYKLLEIIEE